MNWKIINSDLKDAREQIEEIEERIKRKDYSAEPEYQILLEHIYRHLNIAWNARRAKTKSYKNMTQNEFDKLSSIPKEIQIYKLKKNKIKKGS
ncbi:MAG: hypothetical protein PHO67_06400 [Candidatus Omnitrophica bacterium]|nr:hypothetical protein [Candidatus Omnitrophota bacterium]